MSIYTFLTEAPEPRTKFNDEPDVEEAAEADRVESLVRERNALQRMLHGVMDAIERWPEAFEAGVAAVRIISRELRQPGVP